MMNYSREKILETVLAIVTGLLAIYFITSAKVLIKIALVLAAVGITWIALAGWITWAWLKFSHVLGAVMSRVLMGVVFYVVLFPISLLARLSRKDGLQLKRMKTGSYYSGRDHTYAPDDLANPW